LEGRFAAAGRTRAALERVLPLDVAAAAQKLLPERGRFGKIVVHP
jgi:hypothetical protein